MTTESLKKLGNEYQYDLLDELLTDQYDKFEENDDKCIFSNGLNLQEREFHKNNVPIENGTNSSCLETNKMDHNDNDELYIQEGEILNCDSGPVEITSMFKSNMTLVNVFHEHFQGNHLILKIYDNFLVYTYCKLQFEL